MAKEKLWVIGFAFLFFFFLPVIFGEFESQTFIVRVDDTIKLPAEFTEDEDWYGSILQRVSLRQSSARMLHLYRSVFRGFSVELTEEEAEILKSRPEILGLIPDRVRQIHTTRSPEFLGLTTPTATSGLMTESNSGSNVVIGVLDTGIWPERGSFNDEGMEPIPPHWKGECVGGRNFSKSLCNRKIVGARFFSSGYEAAHRGLGDSELNSARDIDGHGSHTASTAAGRTVNNASLLGYAAGTAIGIAPKARLAVYKVCWELGCLDSDILSAFDKAIEDGVDVISLSVGGGPSPYHHDSMAIGAFAAMERGIFVAASAGNGGPASMTVTNVAPWMTTVGASTMDRAFPADLLLENGRTLHGASLYKGDALPEDIFFPLHYAASLCLPDSLRHDLVRGKIVVCDRGGTPRAAKGLAVKKAGGVGVVIASRKNEGDGTVADAHLLPGLTLGESDSAEVRNYISSSENPKATMIFRGTELGTKPAPVVAFFSSRGPNPESPYVIKPEIIAPGVNILAAWTDAVGPTNLPLDTRRVEFTILSGTSMSCPHVSGLAALLKGAHPGWSPAAIRSALMTTSNTHGRDRKPILDEKGRNASTVEAMGAGHVDPVKAVDPGLIYNLTADDYLGFLCASNYTDEDVKLIAKRRVSCGKRRGPHRPWDLNHPGISVDFDAKTSDSEVTVTRTLTQVSDGASTYVATINNPEGAMATVDPVRMEFFKLGDERMFTVTISLHNVSVEARRKTSEFGRLTWTDGKHEVSSPVVATELILVKPFELPQLLEISSFLARYFYLVTACLG